jgi:ComF family protein
VKLLEKALDFIYPPECLVCGKPGKHPLCPTCSEGIVPDVKTMSVADFNLTTIFNYSGTGRDVMHLCKFDGFDSLAVMLADIASNYIYNLRPRVLVPVPVHFLRIRQRGYNQSAIMAMHLAKKLQWTYNGTLLARVRNTHPQFSLGIDERIENVENSMGRHPLARLDPKLRYMIVDDIVTTGATLKECSRALRTMGARHIDALALFHAGSRETMLPPAFLR